MCCEQTRNTAKHYHSLSGEPRIGIFSRPEKQQGTTATHQLESQGQALLATRNTARHDSHSQTREPRTDIVSRLETQQGTTAAHRLESQGQALLAG